MHVIIVIDIRSLMTPHRTGVGEYTVGLLTALFEIDKKNQYLLFYNSLARVSTFFPKWQSENVFFVKVGWPNKILNSAVLFYHQPDLDNLTIKYHNNLVIQQSSHVTMKQSSNLIFKKCDIFFSPNLNFTTVSESVKHVLTIHDLSFEFLPDCFIKKQLLWHKLLNPERQCQRADLILTPSKNTKSDVIWYYGVKEEKVRVLYPGVDSGQSTSLSVDQLAMATVKKKYHLPEKFILFLGTIEPRKNIRGLIEAFRRLKAYDLVIAGAKGWNNNDVFQAIQTTPQVQYIGYVDEADKPALYQLADVFIYPSLYEGFGFPVVEAMQFGTPVVTSNRSSLPEVTNGAAYLVNPINYAEIASAIQLLLTDVQLRTYFVIHGRAQAQKFQWRKAASKLLELFSEVSSSTY